MTTKTPGIEELNLHAERAVGALEDLPPGTAWAAADDEATEALSTLKDSAAAELFPRTMTPASDAALRDFGMETKALGDDAIAELISLHGSAIAGSYPPLAALIRGPRGRRLVVGAACRHAHAITVRETHATAAARAGLEALTGFQQAIAEQLVGVADYEPAASIIAVSIPDLRQRLDAARLNHDRLAVAALDEIEAEKHAAAGVLERERADEEQAAAAVAADAEQEAVRQRHREHLIRSRNLADRILERGSGNISIGGKLYSRGDIAGRLRAGELSASRWFDSIDAAL